MINFVLFFYFTRNKLMNENMSSIANMSRFKNNNPLLIHC